MRASRMREKGKHLPPVCPECKKPIKVVYEQIGESYSFNEETGTYDHDSRDDSMDMNCEECGADLSRVFELGVCNFGRLQGGTL